MHYLCLHTECTLVNYWCDYFLLGKIEVFQLSEHYLIFNNNINIVFEPAALSQSDEAQCFEEAK